jgi:hypothetical protein
VSTLCCAARNATGERCRGDYLRGAIFLHTPGLPGKFCYCTVVVAV